MNAKKIEIDPAVFETVVARIEALVEDETTSAYGISKILNRFLRNAGVSEVRSQMMYNYAKNGLIVRGEKIAGETLREFTKREVAEFVARFLLRNGVEIRTTETEAAIDPNQLVLDLGEIDS